MDPRGVFDQLPESEQRLMIEAALTRGMSALAQALTQDTREAHIDEFMRTLRDEGEEE
jgi:hypothetical protein